MARVVMIWVLALIFVVPCSAGPAPVPAPSPTPTPTPTPATTSTTAGTTAGTTGGTGAATKHKVTVTVTLPNLASLSHSELVKQLTNGISNSSGVNSGKVSVVIKQITLAGTFSGFPAGNLKHIQIIQAVASMMSVPTSAVTITYGGKAYTGSTGGRRLAQSVDYEAKVVQSGATDVVTAAKAAMGNVSATNLQAALVAVDSAAYSGMSLTEQTKPKAHVLSEAIVQSNVAPNPSSVAAGVGSATGGTAVAQVTAVVPTTTTTLATTTTLSEITMFTPDSWAITPMISIWSVLYAMALS